MTIHYNLWYNIPDQKIKAEVRQQMRHADWHPSHFDPDPSEKVAGSIPQGLMDEFDIPPTQLMPLPNWQLLLPSSNVVIPDMLTVGIKLQAQVQTNDDRR